MIRVRWELEEAVALMDLYFRYGATLSVPNDELLKLSQIYRNRANILGLNVDDKFRNLSGMKMQLGCIHYVVTGGKEGMSGASNLFYKTYDLYKNNPCEFQNVCKKFYAAYERSDSYSATAYATQCIEFCKMVKINALRK